MRALSFVALITLLGASPILAGQTRDENLKRCQEGGPDLRIGGCTALIQGGRETDQNLSKVFNIRGDAYRNKGNYDQAIQDFDQALRLVPNDADSFYNRGSAYLERKDYDRAIQDSDQALRLNPNDTGAFTNRGLAYAAQKPTNQKQIHDPAEYNAYMAAFNMQDPAQKAAAMLAFVNQYPKSIVRMDGLEQAMAAYQQSSNASKVVETARMILQDDPKAVRALAVVTAIDRSLATSGNTQALKESCDDAQKGLQALPTWPKPEGATEPDFDKLKNQMADIFDGAAGFCALQNKDYASAKNYYGKAAQLDPGNLQDAYQLAIADLESHPLDINGFWYGAKAINLAGDNAQARDGISAYVKAKYKNYTGNQEGWDQMVAAAATESAPPANIAASIKAKPTPCEIAVDAVNQNDPATLSISDWEFVLSRATCSPANREAAGKVWQTIQDKQKSGEKSVKLKLAVLVISATRDTIEAAITDENQQAKKADLTVHLETPVLHPPAPGSLIDVVGVLSKYALDPFMFTMDKGSL
jgi:tetratricopeptide (TPR) repeat protein